MSPGPLETSRNCFYQMLAVEWRCTLSALARALWWSAVMELFEHCPGVQALTPTFSMTWGVQCYSVYNITLEYNITLDEYNVTLCTYCSWGVQCYCTILLLRSKILLCLQYYSWGVQYYSVCSIALVEYNITLCTILFLRSTMLLCVQYYSWGVQCYSMYNITLCTMLLCVQYYSWGVQCYSVYSITVEEFNSTLWFWHWRRMWGRGAQGQFFGWITVDFPFCCPCRPPCLPIPSVLQLDLASLYLSLPGSGTLVEQDGCCKVDNVWLNIYKLSFFTDVAKGTSFKSLVPKWKSWPRKKKKTTKHIYYLLLILRNTWIFLQCSFW